MKKLTLKHVLATIMPVLCFAASVAVIRMTDRAFEPVNPVAFAQVVASKPVPDAPQPAVDRGEAPATFEDAAAAYDRGDYATALRLMRPLADQGDARAQAALGFAYYDGKGVAVNYAEAAAWYRLAADQGNAIAQDELGRMYYEARGVPQDYAMAASWSRLAADQGIALAQVRLGIMCALGRGVPLNFMSAHIWFNLAAAGGNKDAIEFRDIIARRLIPEQIAEAQKLAREWKPAAQPPR
jgi:uncharacterized protein